MPWRASTFFHRLLLPCATDRQIIDRIIVGIYADDDFFSEYRQTIYERLLHQVMPDSDFNKFVKDLEIGSDDHAQSNPEPVGVSTDPT